ncbi:MAG: cyclic nucleotide-binding domain-containing protein [Candidatus Magnetoovum sp. WYHC-5]|nr:cyclic nucleotide-binding domain-containing protein [Candidatus Magnetoovum sp. WYHC-5]
MRRIAIKETYKDGQVIIKEGGYGEGTYVILEGKVEITRKVDSGKVRVAVLGKGDYFGEMSFLDRQPRSASAVAIGDVQLGLIDKDFLEEEINKTSEDFRIILFTLAERLRKTSSLMVHLMTENYKLRLENEKLKTECKRFELDNK